jgi:peptide/nickel transport system substrate-binding protein
MSATSKKNTKFIAAAILVVIIVVGVGYYYYQSQVTPSMTSTTSSVSQYKDTIVIGTTDSVQSTLDPADAYDFFANDFVMYNIGGGLVDYAPGTTTIIPNLATDWTSNANLTVWTFNLRQGVKFADGTPFNATVVKYSIDRQMAIDEPEGPFAGVGLDTLISQTVVTGPYQVQFILTHPFAAFLSMVAFNAMFPVNPSIAPMHAIVNYTSNVANEAPNNIGPYALKNWVRTAGKDVEMDFATNPNWWNASSGYPKTANIVVKFYTDPTSLNLALQSGAVDLAYRQLLPTDVQAYESNTNFKVWKGNGAFIQYLAINELQAPFNNTAVRQAIAAALDRSLIVNTVFLGQAVPLYSTIPIGMSYHTDAFKTAYGDANVTLAESLLQSAGYSTTNPLKFTLSYPTGHYPSTDGTASAIKQALEKTGMIQVTLSSAPWSTYKASVRSDQLSIFIYGWYPDFVDPYDYTYPFLPDNGVGFLHTHYVSTNMAQLIQSVGSSTDPATLASTYGKIQDLEATDVPVIPLFQGSSIAVSNLKVGGVVLDTTIIFRCYLLWETV